jgi:4-amino-4-deoxy-L-arabinose transferase-like glycosyltransferase
MAHRLGVTLAALDRAVGAVARGPAWGQAAALVVLCLALWLPGFAGLPPVDRDEASFAQASRQMFHSGDLIDIRLHDEARHKKPVGIYWLQAAAVAATGGAGEGAMATYRAVSLLGAAVAVLLTRAIARVLAGPGSAFAAGALMALTFILGAEARLAKTDATLLAVTLAAQFVLARLWMALPGAPGGRPALARGMVALFWGALAAGMLIKGPVGPMVVALTAAALALAERRAGWLLALRPVPGFALFLVIVLPWYLAITIRTGGAFWAESLGRDLLGKVAAGQEGHGAPPGSYLVAFWLTFWPAALPFALALPAIRAGWRTRWAIFCLCWIVPAWIVFEAVPTKLLHYTLPLYPAVAILAAAGWAATDAPLGARWRRVAAALVLAVPFLLLAALSVAAVRLGAWPPWPFAPGAAVLAAASALVWRALAAGLPQAALAGLAALSFGLSVAVYPGLMRLAPIWPSSAMAAARAAFAACPDPLVISSGYGEPSAVFLLGRDIRLLGGAGAAEAMAGAPCALLFLAPREAEAFAARAAELGLEPVPAGRIEGVNLGSGRRVVLDVLATPP